MQNRDIKTLLHDLEEEDAIRLAEDFPPLTDAEKDRMFSKLTERMAERSDPVGERMPVFTVKSSPWKRHLAAAACLLLLCGTTMGIAMLGRPAAAPPEEHQQSTEADAIPQESARGYAVGERYNAGNFTSEGKLWIIVEKCGFIKVESAESVCYYVHLTLESEHAVSHVPDQPDVFLADNFLLSCRYPDGEWQTIQPSTIAVNDPAEGYPNAIRLQSGETGWVELVYPIERIPEECRLVMGYSGENNYTVLETEMQQNEYDAGGQAPAEEE